MSFSLHNPFILIINIEKLKLSSSRIMLTLYLYLNLKLLPSIEKISELKHQYHLKNIQILDKMLNGNLWATTRRAYLITPSLPTRRKSTKEYPSPKIPMKKQKILINVISYGMICNNYMDMKYKNILEKGLLGKWWRHCIWRQRKSMR